MLSFASCGIYQISSPNGHRYVGSSINLLARKAHHWSELRGGKHHSLPLQRAYNKYEELYWKVILLCEPFERLRYEQEILDTHPEYNVCTKVSGSTGRVLSPETIAKMSNSAKEFWSTKTDRKRPPEVMLRVVSSRKDYCHSEETKQKIRDSRLGRKFGTNKSKGLPWSDLRRSAQNARKEAIQ